MISASFANYSQWHGFPLNAVRHLARNHTRIVNSAGKLSPDVVDYRVHGNHAGLARFALGDRDKSMLRVDVEG